MSSLTARLVRTLLLLTLALPVAVTAQANLVLRPEVERPLLAAQALHQQKKSQEALARLTEVEANGQINALEIFMLERLRASVQLSRDDLAQAATALTRALQTQQGTPAERLALMENLVLLHYQQKAYADAALWAERYRANGGQSDNIALLQAQALYLSGQPEAAAPLLARRVDADVAAQRVPDEIQLKLLASAYQQTKNPAGYVATLEKLARHYPSPNIWSDLGYRLLKRPDLAAALEIDVWRLMRATGATLSPADRLDHAQLALTTGYPIEAWQVLQSGQAAGQFQASADITRLQKLLDQASRMQAEDDKLLAQMDTQLAQAKDGNPWINTGLNLALGGQAQRGVVLMEQGLAKGGLRQPEIARLRLGYALYLAGQKAKARETFASLSTGETSEAAIARLWLLYLPLRP